ncbi:hypothetical protein H5203_18840 [Pseudoalteromonas sp. SG41-1]|uniref:hypothetical protein n=1 Tax=Pseudoalteromonas sp. SG41-1 TaxID=2760979 RepID=UPI0016014E32|nr:hypothetical protein [Pseudoalteromonas sp. SG41-1]MBB1507526.1 hypothetical protein [Pseudoalteromonas sp. SG41-1]
MWEFYAQVVGFGSAYIGFFVPLLISIILFIFVDKKSYFSKENLILLAISVPLTLYFSFTKEIYIGDTLYHSGHAVCFYAIIYFFLKSKQKHNRQILFINTFFTLYLADIYIVLQRYNFENFSHTGIGGAGIVDSLIITPFTVIIFSYLMTYLHRNMLGIKTI